MKNLNNLKLVTEEIIGEDKLLTYVNGTSPLKHYIGFEISGNPHIGSGLMTMLVIKELQTLGVKCSIFLADWHAWINDKFGGDLDFIKSVGTPYFKECMIASAKCVEGVNVDDIEFISASDLTCKSEYWATVIDVAKNTSLSRIQRSIDIMGRKEGETTDFAKLMYPAMQVADIFFMGTHIMHGGMDQRKAHVIALDCAMSMKERPMMLGTEKIKPVAIHHHLLMGLLAPSKEVLEKGELSRDEMSELKMSKSKPMSAVFLNDSEDLIREKIKKAYCKEGDVKLNPILDWARSLSFHLGSKTIEIKRKAEWGGDKTYTDYASLEKDFLEAKLHPMDLKAGVAESIIRITAKAREHLNTAEMKALKEKIDIKVSR